MNKKDLLRVLDVAHAYIDDTDSKGQHSPDDCKAAHLAIEAIKASIDKMVHDNPYPYNN